MSRRTSAVLALLFSLCLGAAALAPASAAITAAPDHPLSSPVLSATRYALPVRVVDIKPGRQEQPTFTHFTRGTMSLGSAFDRVINLVLDGYAEVLPDIPWYAVTDIHREEDVYLVSVVGLVASAPDEGWSIEQGAWFGLLLIRPDKDGWQGALQGTAAFTTLLADVPETALGAEVKAGLDPLKRTAVDEGYIFPWKPGTAMEYVSGVHANGFAVAVNGWWAVDFISDGAVKKGRAPNALLAAAAGTIDWKCSPAAGEKTAAIRVGNLMYAHLVNARDLAPGRVLAQGEMIGEMQPGSFDENCGVTKQGEWQFHVHLGFPSDQPLVIEGWELNLHNHKFYRTDEVRGLHAMFIAGEGAPGEQMALDTEEGVAGGGQAERAVVPGPAIWVDRQGRVVVLKDGYLARSGRAR